MDQSMAGYSGEKCESKINQLSFTLGLRSELLHLPAGLFSFFPSFLHYFLPFFLPPFLTLFFFIPFPSNKGTHGVLHPLLVLWVLIGGLHFFANTLNFDWRTPFFASSLGYDWRTPSFANTLSFDWRTPSFASILSYEDHHPGWCKYLPAWKQTQRLDIIWNAFSSPILQFF